MPEPNPADQPVRTPDDLLAPFHGAFKSPARFRVGTEAEKFGVQVEDGKPLPYEGERSVRAVLSGLMQHGWHPEREHEDGEVIALRRGDASITLEPGGQLELSGAPLATVHQTRAEFACHMAELSSISRALRVAWLGLGFHPFARQRDLPWVPKLRYGVMKNYLPTRGGRALDMMRRTATVQANFDYASEMDAVRKLRVGLAVAPVVTAMFANSPFYEGRLTDVASERARVWLDVDPDRSGLLPFAWSEDFSLQTYVDWALDVPMFLVKRGAKIILNTGQTFRAYMEHGYEGLRATVGDWNVHLNTLFPEVRLKGTLEVRSADSQSTSMICAVPAFFKGLFYAESALAKAEALISKLDHAAVDTARASVAERGLKATMKGTEVNEWALSLLAIAEEGLCRLSHLDPEGRDERVHLLPLRALLSEGQSPADRLRKGVDPRGDMVAQVLDIGRVR